MNVRFGPLPALLGWEFRLQWRYFFWLVAVVITAVWGLLLLPLSEGARQTWLPVLLFADICNIGLLFIAGSLILDRQQGTLDTVATMPIGTGTWLAGKLISLSLLATACGVLLTAISLGAGNALRVSPAVLAASALFTSIGFILACPFRNILNYFLSMALATMVLSLPLLAYFDIVQSPFFWLLPSYPVVLLFMQAFSGEPLAWRGALPPLLVTLIWTGLSHAAGVRLFQRFVAARAGE